jgi:branched-chain amino acid transport system ATP-binding protein
MLAIACALIRRPKRLLLDEPGLPALMVQRIFEMIVAVAGEGVTLLLVEQNAKRALTTCDRGYVMECGAIMVPGSSALLLLGNPPVRKAHLVE